MVIKGHPALFLDRPLTINRALCVVCKGDIEAALVLTALCVVERERAGLDEPERSRPIAHGEAWWQRECGMTPEQGAQTIVRIKGYAQNPMQMYQWFKDDGLGCSIDLLALERVIRTQVLPKGSYMDTSRREQGATMLESVHGDVEEANREEENDWEE